MREEEAHNSIVAAVLKSPKYRHVAPELVARLAGVELGKRGGEREALKAVKNKLHQVAGAYIEGRPDYRRALQGIAAVEATDRVCLLAGACGGDSSSRFHARAAPFSRDVL
ncbi:MAG: hypothetical protein HYY10_00905 [Candidatus Liptonbacteria bacterium]|nr:hypothetical protein [Candidatus Liptonbacteria bacterium]